MPTPHSNFWPSWRIVVGLVALIMGPAPAYPQAVCPETFTQIALGLNEVGGAPGRVILFAGRLKDKFGVEAVEFGSWDRENIGLLSAREAVLPPDQAYVLAVERAYQRANGQKFIHVNLEAIDARRAYGGWYFQSSKSPRIRIGEEFTAFEIRYILSHPHLLKSATFYERDRKLGWDEVRQKFGAYLPWLYQIPADKVEGTPSPDGDRAPR